MNLPSRHADPRRFRRPRRQGWALLLLGAVLIGMIGYQARAVHAVSLRPTVVATIDLERVFDGLQQRAQVDAELTEMAELLKVEGEELAAAIDELDEELNAYPAGTDKHQDTIEQLQLASLEYQAFIEFSRRKLDVEKALRLGRIYQSIKVAARTMAEGNGYDIVFVDDSVVALQQGTEVEVRRQISARRMLYVSPAIDITDALIAAMNTGN